MKQLKQDTFYRIDFNRDPDMIKNNLEVSFNKAIIFHDETIIILDNDCCHGVFNKDENIELGAYTKSDTGISMLHSHRVSFSHDEVKTLAGSEIEDISKWIAYFGIKDRMCSNYNLLRKSCKEVGIEYDFPTWSKE